MKVISKGKDHYVVQMTNREMAHLLGYYSEINNSPSQPLEGSSIDIHAMYEHLYTHQSLLKKLKEAAKQLREFADVIEKVPVPIKDMGE